MATPDDKDASGKTGREAKLAAALRANLRRRKAEPKPAAPDTAEKRGEPPLCEPGSAS